MDITRFVQLAGFRVTGDVDEIACSPKKFFLYFSCIVRHFLDVFLVHNFRLLTQNILFSAS